jgi:hypothetical protein
LPIRVNSKLTLASTPHSRDDEGTYTARSSCHIRIHIRADQRNKGLRVVSGCMDARMGLRRQRRWRRRRPKPPPLPTPPPPFEGTKKTDGKQSEQSYTCLLLSPSTSLQLCGSACVMLFLIWAKRFARFVFTGAHVGSMDVVACKTTRSSVLPMALTKLACNMNHISLSAVAIEACTRARSRNISRRSKIAQIPCKT